jgi:hypothetical protein
MTLKQARELPVLVICQWLKKGDARMVVRQRLERL